MLSGPTHPLFACNTQWECIGGLTPTHPPLGAYVLNGRPPNITNINNISLVSMVTEHISEKEYLARRAGVFTTQTSVSGQSSPSRSSQNDSTTSAFDGLYDDVPSPRPVVSPSPRPSTSSSLSSDISSLYAKSNLSDRKDRLLGSQGW